jgi:rubredoxin
MGQSPSLAYFVGLNARYSFHCRPCNWLKQGDVGELAVAFGEHVTFENLKKRATCRVCHMPVDGHFRTLELGWPAGMGGWSGPK